MPTDVRRRRYHLYRAGRFFILVFKPLNSDTSFVFQSMMPTFNHLGDVVLLERVSAHLKTIQRGDVVVAQSPTQPNQTVCKRIRAVQGDRVIVPSNNAAVNPRVLVIPPGHVWLEGDNPLNSSDSRHYGPIPSALVKGRVIIKV